MQQKCLWTIGCSVVWSILLRIHWCTPSQLQGITLSIPQSSASPWLHWTSLKSPLPLPLILLGHNVLKLGSYRLEDEHGERQPESSHYLPPIRHFRYLKTAILFSRILNIFLPPMIQCSLSPSFNLSWGRELNRGEEEVWLWEQVCNRAGSRDGGPRDNLLPDVWPPKSATSLGLLLWSTTWKGTRKRKYMIS